MTKSFWVVLVNILFSRNGVIGSIAYLAQGLKTEQEIINEILKAVNDTEGGGGFKLQEVYCYDSNFTKNQYLIDMLLRGEMNLNIHIFWEGYKAVHERTFEKMDNLVSETKEHTAKIQKDIDDLISSSQAESERIFKQVAENDTRIKSSFDNLVNELAGKGYDELAQSLIEVMREPQS